MNGSAAIGGGRRLARAAGSALGVAALLAGPASVAAHGLSPRYQSPLPLVVYLAGAAAAVALSFLVVLARDLRAPDPAPGRVVGVPRPIRFGLRLLGLAAWAWIIAQGVAGGSSAAAVAPLLVWIGGWVVVAAIGALVAPAWEWLDPFATLHALLAGILRRLGVRGLRPAPIPPLLGAWTPAVGLAGLVWVELVLRPGPGDLTALLAGYTVLTLVAMAQFGRDEWRAGGEPLTAWFRTLNLLAPRGLPDDAPGGAPATVVVRPAASALLAARWTDARVVLVAIGVGSIIYDGLSQTAVFAEGFGATGPLASTVLLAGFLAGIAAAALAVARSVGPAAIGAGLLPIAVGYLVAHYLTFVLVDGQFLLVAVSDPLQRGDDLFGTAFFEPTAAWLPPGLVWTVQIAAVVGGHVLGAWAGHVAAQGGAPDAAGVATAERPARAAALRRREIPLAIVMVALTTLTLWSLGQTIVVEEGEGAAPTVLHAPGRSRA